MPFCFIYSTLNPIKVVLKANTSMLLDVYLIYGTLGCQVFKREIQNYIDFLPKINIIEGSSYVLGLEKVLDHHLMGIILEFMLQKLKSLKMCSSINIFK